jgi:BirA family biotin operon repressor/biotin-[acetyl-CoA-carboxylase] ligase
MSTGPVHWNAEALWEAVEPLLPGFSVEVLPEIDSTNTELMRRARAGQMDPVLLVAERQTAGRGRLGRDWQGAPGLALAFSLGLPLTPPDWSGLSLAVGLSVAKSLHPTLKIKWPNDVWLGDHKLAGILIETALFGDTRYAVIGIGINIGALDGHGMRTPPAALIELLTHMTAPLALQQVVPALVADIQAFALDGFAPLREQFHARDLLYGREVECTDGTLGLARGVDAAGALLVHTASGLKKITSAEVSVRPGPLAKPAT